MALPALGFDTETEYCKKTYSVKELGPWHYCRHERFNCYLVSVSDGSESWAGSPRDFNFDALKGRVLVSQNKMFDANVAKACEEKGIWPKIEYAEWHCTGNMSSFLWNVRSLADAARIGLGIEVAKSVRDRADGKTEADMRAEGWWEDMVKYGAGDAVLCQQLWAQYSHKWPEFERRISNLTIDQGNYGVAIDIPKLERGIIVLQTVIQTAQSLLPWIARGRKPGSPIGLAEECRAVGIPCAPVKTHHPEEYEEWLEAYAFKHPFVGALRSMKKAEKMLATFETIKLRLREDGTAAFALLYFGAHTGRFSGTGGWNLQNPNKLGLVVGHDNLFILDVKRILEANEAYDAGYPLPEYAKEIIDLRGLIIARPGKILCPCDLSQIEPRVMNWLVGNQDFLDLVASGQSPYEAHARLRMGWTGGELKKEDKKRYHFAKERVLQLQYSCGWEKFMKRSLLNGVAICDDDEKAALEFAHDGQIHMDENGIRFVEAVNPYHNPAYSNSKPFRKYKVEGCNARKQVNDFREKEKGIVALWENLQAQIVASIGGDLVLELPSGRALTYRDVRAERRKVKDKETDTEYVRNVLTARIGNERSIIYGGLLGENLCQAIARDAFCHGMLELVDAGYWVLFHAHDEAIPEVSLDTNPRGIEGLMTKCPTWLGGCPLAAEATLTARYRK